MQFLSRLSCIKFQTCSKPLRYRGDKSHWKSHLVYTCDFEVATSARQKLPLSCRDKNRLCKRALKEAASTFVVFVQSCNIAHTCIYNMADYWPAMKRRIPIGSFSVQILQYARPIIIKDFKILNLCRELNCNPKWGISAKAVEVCRCRFKSCTWHIQRAASRRCRATADSGPTLLWKEEKYWPGQYAVVKSLSLDYPIAVAKTNETRTVDQMI